MLFRSDSVRGLVDRNILRQDFVDALFGRHLYDHPGYYGEMIWISMMLEQWLRRNVGVIADGSGSR